MAFQFSFSRSDRHPWLNPKEMLLVSCRRRRTHEQLTVTAVGFPVWHFFLNPSRASPAGVAGLPLAQNLCAVLWTFSGAGPSTIMHEAPNLYGNYQGIPVAIPRKFFGRTRDFYLTEYIQTETADLDLSSPGTPPAESLPVGVSSVLMQRPARLQRQLSRKAKGRQNREKARRII